ncbi:protein kinase [Arthrobacter sp. I2-34]|uniref:Protein kinase n=1 Tax=Arthrobacter hankyongi TaxID=2904801 RepID=A0ABS9LBZ8_9MICC|nr:protein kinase [Arthrobacter hankyongi]MCG2624207.1 protein kinase [Arthrobacter hankyongi]
MNTEQSWSRSAGAPDGPEPPRPVVEGLQIVRWLGSGATASVWLAVAADGTEYALKVFPPAPAAASLDGSSTGAADAGSPARELGLLAGVEHEHLVRAYRRVATSLGPGLLLTFAAGGSLAALLAARGPLSAGEAVTVLTPLGQVLAFLHGQGVIHGDLAPGNVLFTAAGKPLLADLGGAWVAGTAPAGQAATPGFGPPAAESSGPETDVYALSALGWFALTGRVPAAAEARPPLNLLSPAVPAELVQLLEEGLDEDPVRRPSAADFARRAYQAAAAEPLDLAAAVHPSVVPQLLTRRPPPRRQARTGRRVRAGTARPGFLRRLDPARLLLAGTALTAALGLVIALAGMLAGPPVPQGRAAAVAPAAAASAPAAPPTQRPVPGRITAALGSGDPMAALPGLAWLRTEALRTRNPALLADVNAHGSAAMAADRKIIGTLREQDHWFAGLEATVAEPELAAEAGAEAVVSAVVTTSGFRQYSRTAGLVREVAGAKTQRLRFRLEQEGGRWRISEILAPEG